MIEIAADSAVIGRAGGGAHVQIEGDELVSRQHGRLWVEKGEVWYEDLQSSNGSWLDNERLTTRVPLQPGRALTLGNTRLELLEHQELTLRMKGPAAATAITEVFHTNQVKALMEFVDSLLRSSSAEWMPRALSRLYEVVPAAKRIALVAWPPEGERELRHLVPPEELTQRGVVPGPISVSLARQAVESGDALFCTDNVFPEGRVGDSVSFHGIRSAVYVPLISEQQVLGVLCVDTPVPSIPFTKQDFQFIRAVGGLLSTALASEKLRDEARRAREIEAHREAMVSFLKIATHDLKNPLTVINLGVAIMRKTRSPEVAQEQLSSILNASRRAQDLIHAYLEVAARESGQALQLSLSQVDPHALVEEEIDFLSRALDARRTSALSFANRVDCGPVRADPQKLRQILGNLLSNACKYSPDGGRISVESERSNAHVTLKVHDQGIGISHEDQERLFGEFQRVGDHSLAPGTGLGLWLTHALVTAHGGRIWVESEPGRGSTFAFTLPQA